MPEPALSAETLERTRALRRAALESRRTGDHARAFALFSAVARDGESDATLHHEIGSAALALGRFEEAQMAFAAALALEPDFVDAIRGLGHCARRQGYRSRALAHFTRAMALSDDPRIRFEVATECVAVGVSGAEAYADLLADGRTRVRACNELALISRRDGDLIGARHWLQQAVAADQTDRTARHALAEVNFQQWRLVEAATLFDALLVDDHCDTAAFIGRGLCARRMGDRDLALSVFEAAFRIDPQRAASELARELRDAGEFDRADDVLQQVRMKHADEASVLVQLGLVAGVRGKPDVAIARFKEAIQLTPAHLSAHLELASEQQRQGRVVEARASLLRAAVLAPEHPRLLETQGDTALAAGSLERALEYYQQAATRASSQASLNIKLARCYAMLGRVDDALGTLDALALRLGPSPDVVIAQAQIAKDRGFTTDALATLQAGASMFPTSFPLWLQASLLSIEAKGPEAVVAPATTRAERCKALVVRGAAAAARWDFTAAQTLYTQALEGNLGDGGIHFRLAQAALANLDIEAVEQHLGHLSRLEGPVKRLRGEAVGPTKSLLGQIVEEARLDPVALECLLMTRASAPGEHSETLRAVVRDVPGITLPALQLMISLRQRGVLSPIRSASKAVSPIPRTIVQFWHSPDLPDDLRPFCESWREINPDYVYRRFSEHEAAGLLAREFPRAIADAFRRAREPAMKADVFRLAYLARFGGIYADVDDRCVSPVGRLLAGCDALVLYQEDIGSIGNNVIAAAPRHTLLVDALDRAADAIAGGDCDIAWLSTGPGLLTRVIAEAVARQGTEFLARQGVSILERRTLLDTVATGCMAAYKHTPRHWSRAAFLPIGGRETAADTRHAPPDRHL